MNNSKPKYTTNQYIASFLLFGVLPALVLPALVLWRVCAAVLVDPLDNPKAASPTTQAGTAEEVSTSDFVEVTPEELRKAYEDNVVAADQRYEGQHLLVRGAISSIGEAGYTSYIVNLDGGVVCWIDKDEAGQLSQLKIGDPIAISGYKRDYDFFGGVALHDCAIED